MVDLLKNIESNYTRIRREVPLLDQPEIGHMEGIVIRQIELLGEDAFGFKVVEVLTKKFGLCIHNIEIHNSIKILLELKLIEIAVIGEESEFPHLEIYNLTIAGKIALKKIQMHYRAVVEYFI